MSNTKIDVDAETGEVTITRVYEAPRELVFRAMIEPEQFVQFWGPTGTHVPIESVVIEPWAGGRFESTMVADDGSGEFPLKGVFVEVVNRSGSHSVSPSPASSRPARSPHSTTVAPRSSSGRPTSPRCTEARRHWPVSRRAWIVSTPT